MSRWIDEVEAAVDSYGDTWARSEHEATDNAEAVALRYRAILLALVTKGRCPECGESTIPDCNVNGRHVDHLCVSCEWTDGFPVECPTCGASTEIEQRTDGTKQRNCTVCDWWTPSE